MVRDPASTPPLVRFAHDSQRRDALRRGGLGQQ